MSSCVLHIKTKTFGKGGHLFDYNENSGPVNSLMCKNTLARIVSESSSIFLINNFIEEKKSLLDIIWYKGFYWVHNNSLDKTSILWKVVRHNKICGTNILVFFLTFYREKGL